MNKLIRNTKYEAGGQNVFTLHVDIAQIVQEPVHVLVNIIVNRSRKRALRKPTVCST